MPTGVYDASLITQRARAKAESNSFINRIQNPINPTTSYGPLTGIYDNSEVNRVNNGQMKYFQRNGACTVAYIGCPCTVLTPSGQVANNVIVIPPGPVQGLSVTYGSVIVSWSAPSSGTGPFTYEIRATPSSGSVVTINPATSPYSFVQGVLTAGVLYTFDVRAINELGTGPAPTILPTIYGLYVAPTITTSVISSSSSTGATIDIGTYSLANGQFNITGASVVGGSTTPSFLSSTSTTVAIGNLAPGTNSNYTMYLTGGVGKRSETSSSFSIKTLSVAPAAPTVVTPITSLQVTCNLAPYSGFTGPITVVNAFDTSGSPPYPEFSVSYTAGNSSFIINVPNYNTLYDVRISITNGTFVSELSPVFAFTSPLPPQPSIQNLNYNTVSWTNATLTFDSYSFDDFSIPTGATVTSATYGTLQVINVTSSTAEIIILNPGTAYNDLKLVLIGSGGITSPQASIPGFNTNGANPLTAPPVTATSITTSTITYTISIGGYIEQFSSSYITANIPANQTQILSSSYTPDYNTGFATVVVSGLTQGTTYENVKLALTDNSIYFTSFAEPGNFTTNYDGPQNLNIPTSGINVTSVIIEFDTYSAFDIDPTNTTVSDGNNSLTISGVTQSSVSLSNLFTGTTYSGYQLTLQSSTGQTAQPVSIDPFSPTYPAPVITSTSPGENDVTIFYEQYTAITVNSAIVNDLNPSASISISNLSNTQMTVSGLSAGTTYTCSITLSDGFVSSLPSLQITFTTTSQPPSPDPPNYTGYTTDGSGGVTLYYTTYSSFTPNTGTLYINGNPYTGSATTTDLVVNTGLPVSQTYFNCYFTISDGTQTSSSSNIFDINL